MFVNSPTNVNKKRVFNVPLNIFLFNNLKNLADFYNPRLSNVMEITVQKNNQIWDKSLEPVKTGVVPLFQTIIL